MAKKRQKYRAAKGARFNDKMAEVLGEILEKFGDALTPEQLVEIARPARSPIHKLFTWDDTKAAHEYRVEQARNHLRHIEVVIIHEGKTRNTRAYHAVVIDVDEPNEKQYVTHAAIMKSPELSRQVVKQASKELKVWRTRYTDYSAIFGGVFREADRVLAGT